MITIFSSGNLSALSSQAVSTIRLNIFGRLDPQEIAYYTTADEGVPIRGAIRKTEFPARNKYIRFLEKLRYLRALRPDFLMVTGEPLEVVLHILRPVGTRTILHMNGSMPSSYWAYPFPFSPLLYLALVFFVRRADFIFAITRHGGESLRRFGRDRSEVFPIYNGVDLAQFCPGKKDPSFLRDIGVRSGVPVAVFTGMLTRRKRPELVVKLAEMNPGVQFLLIGAPSPDCDILSRMRSQKNILWIKNLSRDDLAKTLASADVFIFPSLYEGFGMVIAEAMASGCPVVASRHYGPGELIEDGENGLLVDPVAEPGLELERFNAALRRVLEDKGLRAEISKNGREKAEREFDWNRLAQEWRDALLRID